MKNKCPFCQNEVNETDNFCSCCGEALNEYARVIINKKDKTSKLKLLYVLIENAKDPKTLNLLNKALEKLNS